MKKTILLLILLCIFSCKKKDRYGNIQTLSEKKAATENKYDSVPSKNEEQVENIPQANCYDYLTELVRSSDFPFSDWNIQPNKVNLLIDHEDADSISCHFFMIQPVPEQLAGLHIPEKMASC